MKKLISVPVLLLSLAAIAQSTIDESILEHMDNKHVSGLAAVIISNDGIEWEGYYGLANRQADIPVTDSTIFMLASISKTVTATALMQLWEDGLFELDDPVNDYLTFDVMHPDHPETEITIRQLLTHTSSIKDNWDVMDPLYVNGDSPIALEDFMNAYFTPGGEYYSATANFYAAAPGSGYHYSNIGAALCGSLVEAITGTAFNTFCNEHIFDLLCMEHTAWFLSELDESLIAHPYSYFAGFYTDEGLYGYPDYPDGQLRTTARSLAKFLFTNMTGGSFEGNTLLESATIDSMRTIQDPLIDDEQGLIWYTWSYNGATMWGHNGGDAGVVTDMFFDPATQRGYIILTNGNAFNGPVMSILMNSGPDDWYEEPIAMSCELPVALSGSSDEVQLSISPNPAANHTRIMGTPVPGSRYRISDMEGKVVCNWTLVPANGFISTTELLNGSYLLEWSDGRSATACVLMVQNR